MAYKPVARSMKSSEASYFEGTGPVEDLRQVGDLLRDIRDLSDEAERLNRNIERLERAQSRRAHARDIGGSSRATSRGWHVGGAT